MYPRQALYWRDAAIARLSSGDESSALALLEEAVRAEQFDTDSVQLLAILSFNHGDYARAIAEGELAARLRPSDATVYDAPVQARMKLSQWHEAETLLGTALQRAPNAHLHVLLARVYAATDRPQLAMMEVDAALALDPSNSEALQLRSALR